MRAKNIVLWAVCLSIGFAFTSGAAADLIRHYQLESISAGTTADATGNSVGTVNGTPTVVTGILGNAFNFNDLSTEHVVFTDPFFGQSNVTLSYWIRRDTASNNDGPAANWSDGQTVLTRIDGSTIQTFARVGGSQSSGVTDLALTDTSAFHNLVVTYDSDTSTLQTYLDGVGGTPQTFSGSLGGAGSGTFAIGGRGSSEREMDGAVDDLAMWNSTLDVGQVRSLHGLATTNALNYDAGNAQSLFNVFEETSTSETIGGKTWTKTGAATLNGAPGDVVWLGGSDYGLVLDNDGRGVATKSGNLQEYRIDIDSTDGGGGPIETAPGWVSLNATGASNSDTVTVNGVTFQPFSADGSRIRRVSGAPVPNALTGDFIFDDGPGEAVGLQFGGAGDLPAGIWDVKIYSNDAQGAAGNQFAAYRENGSPYIVSNAVAMNATDPAVRFQFESDGASAYDVFMRENNTEDRSRLNAVHLTYVTPLTPANNTMVRFNLDDGPSDVSSTAGASQADTADVVSPLVTVSQITSGPGWGKEVGGNNANVGNGVGGLPHNLTDDGHTWWSRAEYLPNGTTNSTHFAEFTIDAIKNFQLDLSEGVLGVKMGATDRDQAGPFQFNIALRSSLDGFGSDLDAATLVVDDNDVDPIYVTSYFDLSSLGMVQDPLSLRLYFSDNSASNFMHPILDSVFLLGNVIVPEPHTITLAVFGVLGVGLLLYRRRRN